MKKLSAVLLTAVVVGAPLGYFGVSNYNAAHTFETQRNTCEENLNTAMEEAQAAASSDEPLTVSLGVNNGVTHDAFTQSFDLAALQANAKECESTVTDEDLTAIADQFKDVEGQRYTFSYEDVTHEYTVLPNLAKFKTMDEFKKYFDVCALGGSYPIRMNANWLVFSEGWGGGASDDSAEMEKNTTDLNTLKTQLQKEGAIELN